MASGESEFRHYCSPCHGLRGTGNGPVAQTLKKKPADLTSLAKNDGGVFPAPYLPLMATPKRYEIAWIQRT